MSLPIGIARFPDAGCIVEFMQGNRPQIAWVLEEQGGRLRLLLPNRRELKLTASRLLPWSGPSYQGEHSRDAIITLLETHKQKRDAIEASTALLDLWEMVQGEVEKASVEWFAELLHEQPSVDDVAAIGHALLICKTHFKFHAPDFEVYDAERVAVRLAEQEAARIREALVESGQNFIRILWDVHCHKRTLPPTSSSEYPNEEVSERLMALIQTRMADPDDHDSESVWKQLAKGLPDDQHVPLHLATAWGLVARHHNFWMDRADYAVGNAWSGAFADEIQDLKRRVAHLYTQWRDDAKSSPETLEASQAHQVIASPDELASSAQSSQAVPPVHLGASGQVVSSALPDALEQPVQPDTSGQMGQSGELTPLNQPDQPKQAIQVGQVLQPAQTAEQGDTPPYDAGCFISIDSPTTRDIDDAFDIIPRAEGGFILRVALAAPVTGWEYDSPLDKAVLRRATSIYLPEGSHNMLPEELGTDFYSLVANQLRPSLVVDITLDAEGTVLTVTPCMTWVSLAANLTYEACESVLEVLSEGDAYTPELGTTLTLPTTMATAYAEKLFFAEKLMRQRQELRIKAGAVIIERDDPKITLDVTEKDTLVRVTPPVETPRSQLLVSEMMILANASIAAWAQERNIALLHRTQDVGIPKEYAGVWREPHHIARVVKALSSAVLEVTPRPHAGIGAPAYSPITSPLRRYPDLINEEQIAHYLQHGQARWTHEELTAKLPLLSARLDAAGQVQRFRPRYWKLLYVKQHDKEWFDAVVTEENDAFVSVSLPALQIVVRGRRATFGDKVNPGQFFQVRLGKVHPLYNEIQILDAMEA